MVSGQFFRQTDSALNVIDGTAGSFLEQEPVQCRCTGRLLRPPCPIAWLTASISNAGEFRYDSTLVKAQVLLVFQCRWQCSNRQSFAYKEDALARTATTSSIT